MTNNAYSILEEIESLLNEGAEFKQLVDPVHKLVSIAPLSLASIFEPGTQLYRATNHHNSLPTKINDIWYPPDDKASLGRANQKGQAVFYCSSDPSCVFHEIGTKIGNLAVLATWVTTKPMLLHEVGYSNEVLSRAGSRRNLPDRHHSFTSKLDEKGKIIREFLFLAFTEPTSTKYAFTTAIAEVFLRADEFSGLLYPAVSKFANVDNLALRPEFVRDGLKLEAAQLVKIDEIGDDKSVRGEILFDLINVSDDGTLHWKPRETGVSVPPESSHQIKMGDSLRVQSTGEIEVDGKRYHIEPGYTIEFNELGFFIRDLRGNPIRPIS